MESSQGCHSEVHMQDHVASSVGAIPKQYGREGGGNRGAKLARRSKQQVRSRLGFLETKVNKSSLCKV